MEKSNNTQLVSLLGELTNPQLDGVNPHFKSRYATLGGIINHIRPTLQKHGAAVIQDLKADGDMVGVSTKLIVQGNEYVFGPVSIKHGGNVQQLGSVVTYLRRYSLMAALGIVGDDDDDGSGSASSSRPQAQAPQKPAAQHNPAPDRPYVKRNEPSDNEQSGSWRSAEIHFGKNKGTKLGAMKNANIHWYFETWMPKKRGDEKFPPREDDLKLFEALEEWHNEVEANNNRQPEPTQEDLENSPEVPF